MGYTVAVAAALVVGSVTPAGAASQARATAPVAAPSPTSAPSGTQPVLGYPQALILIRSSLAALQQADETGNYAVLYALGSKSFQAANPPVKLAQTFARLRGFNLNAVLVLEPRFTEMPHLTKDGMMVMKGAFATEGKQIAFQLFYTPENGRWRLFGIGADVH